MPDDPSSSFEALARACAARSVLASLPADLMDEFLRNGRRWDVPAGFVLYRAGDVARNCGLVVSGLLRQYIVSPSGREMTLRYGRPGTLAGAVVAVSGPTGTWAQAVVDSSVLLLDLEMVRKAARTNAEVAWALAAEIASTHRDLLRSFNDTAFGSMRARVARHLLDLTTAPHEHPSEFVEVRVTQQELADAVGSVRESVARVLRDLRDDRLVETRDGTIVLLDPIRLSEEAEVEA